MSDIKPRNILDGMEFSNRVLYCTFEFFRHIPLLKRIYPSLLKKWAALTWVGGCKVKRYMGFYLLLNYKNSLDRKIGLHGGHELEQFSYFFSNMRKGCDIFLDIGANIGTYTLKAAKSHLAKEVHAFEPDPRNLAQMMGNLYLNRLTDNVRVHALALSDKSGDIYFEMGADHKPDLTKVSDTKQGRKLVAKTLDEVLPNYRGKRIFIKIDTEGHEREVLRGAEELLKNNSCFIQVEAWPLNASAVTKHIEELRYHCIHRIHNDYYFATVRK